MSKISNLLNTAKYGSVPPPTDDTRGHGPSSCDCVSGGSNPPSQQLHQPDVKQGEEVVEHPRHYKSRVSKERMDAIIKRINERGYLEAIDVIDAWNLNFNLGSAMKYVLRLSLKDSEITELEKAIEYLKFEIEMRKADIAK